MALTIGTQRGSHEIVALLGKGGMGEVYRARDKKLKREVAIKVLPDEFSRSPERVVRFQREAEVLASVNHPNIGAIYGFEESDGVQALVVELVEGQTLADRLEREAISLDEALHLVRQVADALDAAHEKGIVHRDLKPANVKITPAGVVKVLDFGLAKTHPGTVALGLSEALTQSVVASEHGVVLGAVPYMSPEQARGYAVDKRTDIWAFGCLLYELLTGRRAFPGETSSDTIAAILERAPDWSAKHGSDGTIWEIRARWLATQSGNVHWGRRHQS
jgi:serine/threonine protein kinase